MTLPLPRVLSTQKMDDPGVEIDLLWNEHCDEIEAAAAAIAAHLVAGDPHPTYTTAAEAAAAAPVQSVAEMDNIFLAGSGYEPKMSAG